MAREQARRILSVAELDRRAVDALHGRKALSAAELVELIRQINPTGRGLPEEVEQRRYRVKSQLQSLLLRRFGDEIEVVAEPDRDGVVLLRHRFVEYGFAAHALVVDLDEDARATVRRRLDMADPEALPKALLPRGLASAPPLDEGPDAGGLSEELPWTELLDRGSAARAEYDFDAARTCLEAAVSRSGGALLAALPLCELLVEQLMADGEALQLAARLSTEALASPALRALLALAAARVSPFAEARAQAEGWLHGVADALAAPVFLALTERALQQGADEEAARGLLQAQQLGAPAPELLRLGEKIQALRYMKWRAVESDLEEALAAGDLERAVLAAQALLIHWPESKVARRVIAAAKERRRDEERTRLLSAGRAAIDAGQFERALDCARSAQALGADTSALVRAIETARSMARARREEEQVQGVLRELSGPACRQGLLSYLQLPASLRGEVKRACGMAMLDWLDELGAAGSGARAQAAVEAVLALRAAEALRDPEAVLQALAAQERVLTKLGRARALQGAAHAELLARRRHAAEACLTQAEDALSRGAVETARLLLDSVDAKALDGQGRERRQTAAKQAERCATQQHHTAEFEQRTAAGDLLGAAAEAEALAQLGSPDEHAVWTARRAELCRRVAAAWRRFEVCGTETPLSALPHAAAELAQRSAFLGVWQLLAEDELTLGCAYAGWLFLWNVDVQKQTLRRAVALRLPAPMKPPTLFRTRDALWVHDKRYLLELDPQAHEIRAWTDLAEYAPSGEEITYVQALPDAGCVWISCGEGLKRRVIVLDRRRGKRRELATDPYLTPFLGGPEPRVATLGIFFIGGPMRLYDATGRELSRPNFPQDTQIRAAIHPDGKGIVGIGVVFAGERRQFLLTEAERPEVRHPLPESQELFPPALCTSRAAGLTIAACLRPNQTVALRAYRPSPSGMEPAWEAELPHGFIFAGDGAAEQAWGLYPTDRGCALFPVDAAPPPAVAHIPFRQNLPPIFFQLDCAGPRSELPSWLRNHMKQRGPRLTEEQQLELLNYRQKMSDPIWLLSLYRSLEFEQQQEHLKKIAQMAPDLPLLKLTWAAYHARRQNWEPVRELLEQVDLEQIDEPFRRHGLHILGSLRLRSADVDGARDAWLRALKCPGDCDVESCLAWLDAILSPEQDEGAAAPNYLRTLAGAIRVADKRLAIGDAEGARQALEHTWVLAANEGQSLARLSTAYLCSNFTDPRAQHSKALLLSRFCSWHDSAEPEELFVPGAHWEKDRLSQLYSQAQQWLEGAWN